MRNGVTYCSTILTVADSIAASSLTRWGRFAVFCSCIITPSTISSLMPSKLISLDTGFDSSSSTSASGEGGGVLSSYLMGFGGGLMAGDCDSLCDRFIFFEGGLMMFSAGPEGGVRRAAALSA